MLFDPAGGFSTADGSSSLSPFNKAEQRKAGQHKLLIQMKSHLTERELGRMSQVGGNSCSGDITAVSCPALTVYSRQKGLFI